jgi:hypothetical protein
MEKCKANSNTRGTSLPNNYFSVFICFLPRFGELMLLLVDYIYVRSSIYIYIYICSVLLSFMPGGWIVTF